MNWYLIHKYLSGECTEEEKQKVENWLEVEPSNRKFMSSIKEIWDVIPEYEIEVDEWEAWHNFKKRHLSYESGSLREKEKTKETRKIPNRLSLISASGSRVLKSYKWVAGMAAAAVIVIAVLFYNLNTQTPTVPNESEKLVHRIETERGQQTSVQLSDGSHVKLNVDSKLTIPKGFPKKKREVYLEGQAYFDVKSDNDHPFIVRTQRTYVRVLGTEFSIKAYKADEHSQTVVKEGEVMVGFQNELDNHQVRLRKNDLAILSYNGNTSVEQVEDLSLYLGWRKGQLKFKHTSFDEVEKSLERWYDIKVQLTDSVMYSKRFTATFKDESLERVLQVVSLSLDWQYTKEGRKVTFSNVK